MGSHLNFKNFGNAPPGEGNGVRPPETPLVRQSSIYSLTFDEFQNTWGGSLGKDFGSMNMDELLKNIWSAEETQAMTNTVASGEGSLPGGKLQKQGSLTLPRTLSQKTVDEVWRNLVSNDGSKDGSGVARQNMPQRQQTLGEVTLEEFLVRAGVVREDAQQIARPNNNIFFGDLSRPVNNNDNTGFPLRFQQPNENGGIIGTRTRQNDTNLFSNQHANLALNVRGIRSSQQPPIPQPVQQQQQPLFPKQTNVAFASPMCGNNGQLVSLEMRNSVVGIADQSLNNNLVHGAGMGMVGLGGNVTVATLSPAKQLSPDMLSKSNADTPSPSPIPYVFGRGRRASGALEKVIERRQRRMIKNRESAARSRARKQAYTLELEAEIAKLKEVNEELQKKQAGLLVMQKNEFLEAMKQQWGGKRQCLRRTVTGPW